VSLVPRRFPFIAALALTVLAASPKAWPESYPARSVRAVVPFPPGGATDIIARIVVHELSRQLGQSFYVENVTGASGNIGTGRAARAAPDGYTLLFAYSSYVTNPFIFEKVPYDPYRDFAPVTLMVTSPAVLSVHPSVPARSVKDLVALIRANPGKLNYASGGTGTQPHLAAEQLRLSLGLDLVHVPFNGGGPALTSIIAGQTPVGFTTLSPTVPYLKAGKLRALAVTSRARAVPDVPSMREAGYAGIDGDTWVGVLVPAGTDEQIVTLLNREIVKLLHAPDVNERLVDLAYEPVGNSATEYAAQIKIELAKWSKVIRLAGIKAQ
jgi:tripartite-type tricarboxylate transporter receptor subunit TctC